MFSRGIDQLQTHINPAFQSFNLTYDGCSNSDSSMPSSKESLILHAEFESFDTVIIPIMMTKAANTEEKLTSMKATLDRLSRESV